MKTISLSILALIATMMLCCCSADTNEESAEESKPVSVRINISASAGSSMSRGSGGLEWTDDNADKGEMMNNCFTIIVQGGIIKHLLVSENYTEEKSWVGTLTAKIEPGETTFYSFANIKPEDVGIDPKIDYSTTNTPLPAGFDSKLYSVKGNVLTAADFPKGIPMSNKQTIEIKKTTADVDLEVIRMVAKVKLKITNDTPNEIKVRSVSLTDITKNEANNLYLLPGKDNGTAVEPNLNPSASKEDYVINLTPEVVVEAKTTTPKIISFYVNESVAKNPNYFVVGVKTDHATMNLRAALSKWNTISRNDYLEIPIKLNNYRVRFKVEQFTAIGVLPEVEQNDEKLTIRFKSYGEFHLIPSVVRLSDGVELTPGTDSANGWLFNEWQTQKMVPDGAEGVCIYDRKPEAVPSRKTIEGVVGNRNGYAIHQILIGIKNLEYDIPYRVEIIKE